MAKRRGKYRSTPKRRAALKKAQAVSARKRKAAPNKRSSVTSSRRSGYSMSPTAKRRLAIGASGVAVGAITAGGIVARHKLSGSTITKTRHPIVTGQLGNVTGSHAPSLSSTAFVGKTRGKVVKEHAYVQRDVRAGTSKNVTRQVTSDATKILGRDFTFRSKKSGPLGDSYSITYSHRKLQIGLKDVLGSKLHNRILASQHYDNPFVPRYVPNRGQDPTPDPKNPKMNKKGQLLATKGNWGAAGKRMPISGPRKYIGKYEIFSNLAADYPKKKISGFTTIGSVYAYKRTK